MYTKSKQILLTDAGHTLAEQVITALINAEQSAFAQPDSTEQQELIRVMQKYITALKDRGA